MILFFAGNGENMAEQLEIGDWKKISDLGRGSFGVVSLWKNQITGDTVGK